MKVIRRSEFRSMPWRNGGGTTYEVMTAPPVVPIERFDWRISIAQIDAPGPFSIFPGVDRTIAVLAGPGVSLSARGAKPVTLGPASPPWRFPGEWEIDCHPSPGTNLDFNVMTRRGRIDHRLTRLRLRTASDIARATPLTCICLASGHGLILTTERKSSATLRLYDVAMLDSGDGGRFHVAPEDEASVMHVELARPGDWPAGGA